MDNYGFDPYSPLDSYLAIPTRRIPDINRLERIFADWFNCPGLGSASKRRFHFPNTSILRVYSGRNRVLKELRGSFDSEVSPKILRMGTCMHDSIL